MQCHAGAALSRKEGLSVITRGVLNCEKSSSSSDWDQLATKIMDSATASRSGDMIRRKQMRNHLLTSRAANLGPANPLVPTFGLIDSHCGYQMIMLVLPEQPVNPDALSTVAVRDLLGDGRDHAA
jgi:hypothetical protein